MQQLPQAMRRGGCGELCTVERSRELEKKRVKKAGYCRNRARRWGEGAREERGFGWKKEWSSRGGGKRGRVRGMEKKRRRKMWGVSRWKRTLGWWPVGSGLLRRRMCARIRRGKATLCTPARSSWLRPHPGFRGRILEKRRPGRHWPLREHRLSSANRGPSW